jgi:hypothetical protein
MKQTALHYAAGTGQLVVCAWLVEQGASIHDRVSADAIRCLILLFFSSFFSLRLNFELASPQLGLINRSHSEQGEFFVFFGRFRDYLPQLYVCA